MRSTRPLRLAAVAGVLSLGSLVISPVAAAAAVSIEAGGSAGACSDPHAGHAGEDASARVKKGSAHLASVTKEVSASSKVNGVAVPAPPSLPRTRS